MTLNVSGVEHMTTGAVVTKTPTQQVMEKLRADIQAKLAKGEGADAEMLEYTGLIKKAQDETKAANAKAINDSTAKLASGIKALLDNSKLATLIGEAVHTVTFRQESRTDDKGETSTDTSIILNPRRGRTASGDKSSGNSNGGRATNPIKVDGVEIKRLDFVREWAPEDVKKNSLFSTNKWPTKPSFVDASVEAARAAGHVVEL